MCRVSCSAEYSAHKNELSSLFCSDVCRSPSHSLGEVKLPFFLQSCSIYHTVRLERREQTCQTQKMRDRTKRNRPLKKRKRQVLKSETEEVREIRDSEIEKKRQNPASWNRRWNTFLRRKKQQGTSGHRKDPQISKSFNIVLLFQPQGGISSVSSMGILLINHSESNVEHQTQDNRWLSSVSSPLWFSTQKRKK